MSDKIKRVCSCIAIFCALIIIAEAVFLFKYMAVYIPILIIIASVIVCVFCILGLYRRKESLFKLCIITLFLGAIGVGIYLALEMTGVLDLLKSSSNLQEMIKNAGIWAPLVYIIIQFAQVTLVPIPSTITIIAGTMVFSLVEVVIYSTIGLILGSVFAFALGKIFGVKLVVWIVGSKSFNKYQKVLRGREQTMLFLMFLLPVFPDDLLCLIAGITTMSYTSFIVMQVISRPLGVLMSSLGGELIKNIPFKGWYLFAWAGIGIAVILMFVLVWKYSGKIEDKLVGAISKRFGTNDIACTIDKDILKIEAENLVSNVSIKTDIDIEDTVIPQTMSYKKRKYNLNYKD